jgi:hypothetical protein
MTCSDVEKVLPELLDDTPDLASHADFETHLKSCPACSDLVSDLKLIASEAPQLAATDEPSPRVWVGIAAQLRAEGLIREPGPTRRPTLVPASPVRRWATAWWLAPVAACFLAAGAYVVSHQAAPQVATTKTITTKTDSASPVTPNAAQKPAENAAENPAQVVAKTSPSSAPSRPAPTGPVAHNPAEPSEMAAAAPGPTTEVAQSSAEDRQFLSVVSTRTPSMRVTYENQLQAVNNNIRQVQEYLRRNPADADARQQLMDAYQQKALLYQIALDRIQ